MEALNLSVSTWNYISQGQNANLTDVIREIKDDGFGIELWMGWTPDPDQYNEKNLPAIKRQLEGFRCVTLHANKNTIWRDIDIAAYLGAEAVVVHGSCMGLPLGNNQPIEGWGQAEQVVAYAKDKGVVLALENGPLFVMREAVNRLDIGICVDIGHANRDQAGAGPEPITRFITEFTEELAIMHLHDNHGTSFDKTLNVEKSTDEHLVPGDGIICWPKVLEHIQSIKFSKPCVLELKTSHPRRAALRARKFLNHELGLLE